MYITISTTVVCVTGGASASRAGETHGCEGRKIFGNFSKKVSIFSWVRREFLNV